MSLLRELAAVYRVRKSNPYHDFKGRFSSLESSSLATKNLNKDDANLKKLRELRTVLMFHKNDNELRNQLTEKTNEIRQKYGISLNKKQLKGNIFEQSADVIQELALQNRQKKKVKSD